MESGYSIEGLKASRDDENEAEVMALMLGDGNPQRLLVNAFDLAGGMARLEDGYIQDPFHMSMTAEGINGVAGGSTFDTDFSPEAGDPFAESYLAAEVECVDPGGLVLLRRLNYEGEDTLEITAPDGAVYTYGYNRVVDYLRPILPC